SKRICKCIVNPFLEIIYDGLKVLVIFFFFQAEDGIRDLIVTGVQTCALPILVPDVSRFFTSASRFFTSKPIWSSERLLVGSRFRSEERRVGKECRFWGWCAY